MAPPAQRPSPLLAPGTQIGPWRVEAWHAQGTYGAVYRAIRAGHEQAGPVAFKVSVSPWDPRFTREADLLSRLSHPCIPQLLDRGVLRAPAGAEHPWFAMQWVEGTPLYAWAAQHSPSHAQLCLLLSGLARVLEFLHASGAVHRDLKGDNVLVRLSDGLPVLIDFGSAHFHGAPRLTWQSLPPSTPAYQSPQAGLFEIRLARERNSYYAPSPADDLYALGVTAYRLVMGQYPPDLNVTQDESGAWCVTSPDVRPLLEQNPRVHPLLREWILRLLSQEPEERGSAAALAQALEAQAPQREQAPRPASAPASEVPIPVAPTSEVPPPVAPASEVPPPVAPASEVPIPVAPTSEVPIPVAPASEVPPPVAPASEVPPPLPPAAASAPQGPRRSSAPRPQRTWRPWIALAAVAAVALVLWRLPPPVAVSSGNGPASPTAQAQVQLPDADTAAVGDSAPSQPRPATPPPSEQQSVSQDPPFVPGPEQPRRQIRPNAKGRCQGPKQVVLNGFCWLEFSSLASEACTAGGYMFLKGKCYAPVLELPQKAIPTSAPGKAR